MPTWVGPLIGVVVGFALNIVYQYFHELWSSPKLIIDGEKAPGKKHARTNDVYMKFRVQNRRKRTVARNCRAYIVAIQWISNGKIISNNLPDSAQLPWEGGDFEPRDIPHGHSQYGDIVHFLKSEPGWVFHAKPNFIAEDNNLKNYKGYLSVLDNSRR